MQPKLHTRKMHGFQLPQHKCCNHQGMQKRECIFTEVKKYTLYGQSIFTCVAEISYHRILSVAIQNWHHLVNILPQKMPQIVVQNMKDRHPPTPILGAFGCPWTFPRAKNCSPVLDFCTSVPTGAALSSPGPVKKTPNAEALGVFWQGHKDLIPGPTVLETAALPIELYPYI